jgi:hypothetical protein
MTTQAQAVDWQSAIEKGFAGIPILSQSDFWRALAAAPRPDRPHERDRDIGRSQHAAQIGKVELTLALDYLVELGHVDRSKTIIYNTANPDGMTVWTYRCSPRAADQQARCRRILRNEENASFKNS